MTKFKAGDEVWLILRDAQRRNGTRWRIVKDTIHTIHPSHMRYKNEIGITFATPYQIMFKKDKVYPTKEEAEKALQGMLDKERKEKTLEDMNENI